MGATKLIFQGVKFYWRTRNTIDVTIVEHTEQDVTEVILFDPALGTEAPRVYLSTPVLYTKLDQEDFELQLSFAKRNSVPITEKFIDGMMNQAKSDFILNRLVITEYVVDLRRVVVSLQLSCVDVGADGLVCEKPAVLEPLKTVHYQTLMAGVVDQAIAALEEEKGKLHTECDRAGELQHIAEMSTKPLSSKQRWRIPIVFIKVSNSKRLNAHDAKIWSAVTQNMRTEEDAARMAAVLGQKRGSSNSPTAVGTPTPSRTASVSGLHLAISPCVSPRHSTLHQTTAATRHRVGAGTPTHSHNHSGPFSRQYSVRLGDGGALSTKIANLAPLQINKEDETSDLNLSTKKRLKTPKGAKKPTPKGSAKRGRKSLLARLRKTLNAGVSPKASQDRENVSEDGSGGVGASDAVAAVGASADSLEEEGEHSNSTLQRMIASLAALNTSLRASFGVSVSSKSQTQHVVTVKPVPCADACAGSASMSTAGNGQSVLACTVDTTLSETQMQLDCAIEQASAGAALVEQPLQLRLQPEHKRVSFIASQLDGVKDLSQGSAGPGSREGSGKGSDKSLRPLAAMQKFISDLVRWRAVNKVYADNDA